MMKLTIGEKLILLRQNANKDYQEIAAHLKIAVSTYVKMEEDFIYPTESMLHKIAKLYGLTYQELLETGE